jgi:hypothetical protein
MNDRDGLAVIKRTYDSQPISFDKYQIEKGTVESKETPTRFLNQVPLIWYKTEIASQT